MSEPTFDIQWKDHKEVISKVITDLHDTHDVTLVCGDSQVHSNKLFLSACSPFMYSVLKDSTNPAVILVTETDPVLFSKLIRYIHTGSLVVDRDDIDELGDLASAFGFNSFTPVNDEKRGEDQEAVEDSRESDNLEKEGDFWKVEYPDPFPSQLSVPSDMNIIDAETYDALKKALVDENLKQEQEGETFVWICGICNRKWTENTKDSRRNSRRHMESHLVAKFQCLMCEKILKSKESFYHHRSSCQHSFGAEVEYQILVNTNSLEAFNIIKDGSGTYACGIE